MKFNKMITLDEALIKRVRDDEIKLSPLLNKLLIDYFFEIDETILKLNKQKEEEQDEGSQELYD